LLQLQHLYSKCVVHNQERDSLSILITYTHSKDAVLNRLTIWGEIINELRAGDRAFPDIKRLNLQHVYARSVRLIVCSVQISEINCHLANLINFLKCVLVIDILDDRKSRINSLNDIFIRSYHGYLRGVSRVKIRFGGYKVIYQNGFLGLQD